MAKAVTLTFDARLGPAVRKFVQMAQSVQGVEKGVKKLTQAAGQAATQLEKTGEVGKRAGKKIGGAMDPKRMLTFIGTLVGAGSVYTAVTRINQAYEVWLANSREIAAEARKAANELITLMALQAGGTEAKRAKEALALTARYGVKERGVGLYTIQAMQSAVGQARPGLTDKETWAAGKSIAETIFAASRVGVPVEVGAEISTIAAAQGLDPEIMLRRAYVAGKASGRDPEALARGAAGFKYWKDKEFGFAAATALVGEYGQRLETYLGRGGFALSDVTSAALAKGTLGQKGYKPGIWERLGVGQGTQFERLEALRAAGLDTVEELAQAGFTEKRGREALETLIGQLPMMQRLVPELRRKAVAGLFIAERARIEKAWPGMTQARRLDILDARFKDVTAFGPGAEPAGKLVEEEKIRAEALRMLGLEQVGPIDLIKEGRAGPGWTEFALFIKEILSGQAETPGDLAQTSYRARLEEKMNEIREELNQQMNLTPQVPGGVELAPRGSVGNNDYEGQAGQVVSVEGDS